MVARAVAAVEASLSSQRAYNEESNKLDRDKSAELYLPADVPTDPPKIVRGFVEF